MPAIAHTEARSARWSIGSVDIDGRVIAAPMAGVSDQPYRRLARRYGAALAVTEMVSASPDLQHSRKSRQRTTHSGERDPISVQLLGADPQQMADAARANVDRGAQIIDINLGCPTKKVCKRLVGSALMKDEPLVQKILESVVKAVSVPVTLKMRTGWDRQNKNATVIARMAEQAGIQALTVHGRSRECRYHGPIDYETIALVKAAVGIPVIANGDIDSPAKAVTVLEKTGADAVMIGRAAQGQPWLLSRLNEALNNGRDPGEPDLMEKQETALWHLKALHEFYGAEQGIRIARKHVQWYAEKLNAPDSFRKAFNEAQTSNAQYQLLNTLFEQLVDQNPTDEHD